MAPEDIPLSLAGSSIQPWESVLRHDSPNGLLAFLVAPPPMPPHVREILLEEELAYAAKLPPRRRREWMAGRICIATALAALAGESSTRMPANRAPLLPAPHGAVQPPTGTVCSLTHKGRLVVGLAARDQGRRVGVDLEHVDSTDGQLAERILTTRERTLVEGLAHVDRTRAVAIHFSLKEAAFKALEPKDQEGIEHSEIEVFGWSPVWGSTWQGVKVCVARRSGDLHLAAQVLHAGPWVLCTSAIGPQHSQV